ncbi:MAG: DNA cytosine methyltransferase [Pseudonocardia sp.]
MSETLTDLFCGAGGSGQGAAHVPGLELRMAANHWWRAIDTHQANFPTVDHDCADISQVDPRRYPRTTILWASPECTNHSGAKGRKRAAAAPGQDGLFADPMQDPSAVRSRATMWDVPRFAEHHRYRAVVVENVVEAARWEMFPAWLYAMECLGYAHRVVWANSMHFPAQTAPRAPQSRDRMYVVFWRRGQAAPELDLRPAAVCAECGPVRARQVFKRTDRPAWGRYRQQYLYRCPNTACRFAVVEPEVLPAASVIDWSRVGTRIAERAEPLADNTLDRIRVGLARYCTGASAAVSALLVPDEGRTGKYAAPVAWPMRTQTTRNETALLVPAGGTWNDDAAPASAPFRARTTREAEALVVPYYGTGVARPASVPLGTQSTRDRFGVAFIAELRGGSSTARAITAPLATVTASGNHHGLVQTRTGPVDTYTSTAVPVVEDCTFRMLAPGEIAAAMAFGPGYRVLGSKRDQVRQLGNAVTPPAAEFLLRAVVASLNGGAS